MLRRESTQSFERVASADQVAEIPPGDGARLRQEERAPTVLGAGRGLLGEREHAVPVPALLAVHLAEKEKRALAVGIELERLLEETRSDLEVLVPQDPPRAERERPAGASLARSPSCCNTCCWASSRASSRPPLGEQALVQRRDLPVGGVRRVRAREHRLRPRRARSAARRARRATSRRPLRRGVAAAFVAARSNSATCSCHVAASSCTSARQRSPRRSCRRSWPGLRAYVAAAFSESPRSREDVTQLEEQRARRGLSAPAFSSSSRSFCDHVQLAEPPVDATGGLRGSR